MYDLNGAGHMGGMWLWWIVGIVFITAVIWVMFSKSSQTTDKNGVSAEELLKRRYASGEIDKDDYEKRLHDMRK